MTATATTDLPWGPSADGLDLPYWEGLRAGELRLQHCSPCDRWIWGPQPICSSCHGFDLEWRPVEPVGIVYTWSRSHYPFISELGEQIPYVTVLVELPAAGSRRVLGILTADHSDQVHIGDPVTGWFDTTGDPQWPLLRWRRTEDAGDGKPQR